MGWKTIEICEADNVKLYLDNLIIYRNNQKIMVGLNMIDALVFDNIRTNISIQLINKLSEYNILVILCNNKHLPHAQIFPMSGNYKSLKVLEQQVKWDDDFKGNMWKDVIIAKINNQASLLQYFQLDNIELLKLRNEVKFWDISNREGHASKIYFHSLFGINFNRNDDTLPLNHLLNYGYAILLGYLSRSIFVWKANIPFRANIIAIFIKIFL